MVIGTGPVASGRGCRFWLSTKVVKVLTGIEDNSNLYFLPVSLSDKGSGNCIASFLSIEAARFLAFLFRLTPKINPFPALPSRCHLKAAIIARHSDCTAGHRSNLHSALLVYLSFLYYQHLAVASIIHCAIQILF
jgi:hypothetical protein